MPSQQADIAEAIAGIKRALRRHRAAPSDEPAILPTNRGNKLQRDAKYIHQGSLAFGKGPDMHKEKIEHAGFTRFILERNPRRYNDYGEELAESETDEEADAEAAKQNAYSGIHLEDLLCPLKHPSELAVHPTMSHAYLSNALPDMVLSTQAKLRQERANLWRAKHLNRQLAGDASWVPAGDVESPLDWDIFEPKGQVASQRASRKRKRPCQDDSQSNGLPSQQFDVIDAGQIVGHEQANSKLVINGTQTPKNEAETHALKVGTTGSNGSEKEAGSAEDNENATLEPTGADFKGVDLVIQPSILEINPAETDKVQPHENGTHNEEPRPQQSLTVEVGTETQHEPEPQSNEGPKDSLMLDVGTDEADSPPPPSRRITRALAANNNPNPASDAPSPPSSPASSSSTLTNSSSELQIDPLYLIQQDANLPDLSAAFSGVLPEEALDTRRLLTLYVQKQEESVRGYEAILSKLLLAQRLRSEVLQMCKAEEHVGELSDGEDWIDAERWGLQLGELKKGRDEDDDVVEESTIGGRKGKRRARN